MKKNLCILILVICVVLLGGCKQNVSTVKKQDHMNFNEVEIKYQELFCNLKFNEARDYLERTLQEEDLNIVAARRLADHISYFDEEFQRAEELINSVVENDKGNWENYMIMGDVYFRSGKYKKAVKAYEKAVKYNKLYKKGKWDYILSNIYYSIALCEINSGNEGAAVKNLEKSAQMNPFNIRTNGELHRLYVKKGKYNKAYEVWRRDNLLDLGDKAIGKYKKWDEEYKKALEYGGKINHYEMGMLYNEILLYDEAKLELEKSLEENNNKEIENVLNEVNAFITFRDELKDFLCSYYRKRCINGVSEEKDFYNRLVPIYSNACTVFDNASICTFKDEDITLNIIKDLNKKIENRFSVRIEYFKSNSDNFLGCHFGYIVGDDNIEISQWGKSGNLRSIVLKNMVSNGCMYWATREINGGVGGWNMSPYEIITILDSKYNIIPMQVECGMDLDKREEYYGKYRETDINLDNKEPLDLFFSMDLLEKFTFNGIEREIRNMREEGYSDNEIGVSLFNKLMNHWYYVSTIIHEGQHALDSTSNIRENWQLEFRAKLSELAYGDMQLYKLINFYSPAIGESFSPHIVSDTKIINSVVQYIYENNEKFPQIDIEQNILMQLPKLSDDDIRKIAIDIFESYYPEEKFQ